MEQSTTFGESFIVDFPSLEEDQSEESDDHVLFFDSGLVPLDKFFRRVSSTSISHSSSFTDQLSKDVISLHFDPSSRLIIPFPLPQTQTYSEYLKQVRLFLSTLFQKIGCSILPRPIISTLSIPVFPKFIPKENLLKPTTYRFFSASLWPLLPENYLVMISTLLTQTDFNPEEPFPNQIKHKETIIFNHHLTGQPQWMSQRAPQEPVPWIYSSYEDFEKSYIGWYSISKSLKIFPIPPLTLGNLLKLNKVEISTSNIQHSSHLSSKKEEKSFEGISKIKLHLTQILRSTQKHRHRRISSNYPIILKGSLPGIFVERAKDSILIDEDVRETQTFDKFILLQKNCDHETLQKVLESTSNSETYIISILKLSFDFDFLHDTLLKTQDPSKIITLLFDELTNIQFFKHICEYVSPSLFFKNRLSFLCRVLIKYEGVRFIELVCSRNITEFFVLFTQVLAISLTSNSFVYDPCKNQNINMLYYLHILLQNSAELNIQIFIPLLNDEIRKISAKIDCQEVKTQLQKGVDIHQAVLICSTGCSFLQRSLFGDNFIGLLMKLCTTPLGVQFINFLHYSLAFKQARAAFFISISIMHSFPEKISLNLIYLIQAFFIEPESHSYRIDSLTWKKLMQMSIDNLIGMLIPTLVSAGFSSLIIDQETDEHKNNLRSFVDLICNSNFELQHKLASLFEYEKDAKALKIALSNQKLIDELIQETLSCNSWLSWKFLNMIASITELRDYIIKKKQLTVILCRISMMYSHFVVEQTLNFTLKFLDLKRMKISNEVAECLIPRIEEMVKIYKRRNQHYCDCQGIRERLVTIFECMRNVSQNDNIGFYQKFQTANPKENET